MKNGKVRHAAVHGLRKQGLGGKVGINRHSTPQVLIVDLLRNLTVEGGEEKCDINDFEDIGGQENSMALR